MELIGIGIIILILLIFFFVYRVIFGIKDHDLVKFIIGIVGCTVLIIVMIEFGLLLLKYF